MSVAFWHAMLLVFTVISFCFRFPQMSSPLPRYWVNMSAFACFVWPPTCINYVDSCLRLRDSSSGSSYGSDCGSKPQWQLHGCPEKSKTEITQLNETEKALGRQIPSENQSTSKIVMQLLVLFILLSVCYTPPARYRVCNMKTSCPAKFICRTLEKRKPRSASHHKICVR